nr:MAG TPA: hypothetical protein [Caudoviricetes sp.]
MPITAILTPSLCSILYCIAIYAHYTMRLPKIQ